MKTDSGWAETSAEMEAVTGQREGMRTQTRKMTEEQK